MTDVADDDLAAVYAELASSLRHAWSCVHDADLVTAPWGPCSALTAVRGFTVETVVHGWDLAAATDQPREVLDAVAQRCLVYASDVIPARLRGTMYGEPIETRAGASATERLASVLGRQTVIWNA